MKLPESKSHSAKVRLELRVGNDTYRLAQIGKNNVIFYEPTVLSATAGEIIAHIDDNIQRWDVIWQPSDLPREILPISPAPILQPS